jgi:hypothetical protein
MRNSLFTGKTFSSLKSFPEGNRRLMHFLKIAGILLFAVLILLFIFRSMIFTLYLQKKIHRFNVTHNAELRVEKAKVKSFSSLLITGIMLKPLQGDTLLKADSVLVTINPWKLITGKLVIRRLKMERTTIRMIRRGDSTNYMFLLERRQERNGTEKKDTLVNLAARADLICDAMFDRIPASLEINRLTIYNEINNHCLKVYINKGEIGDHRFRFPLAVTENDTLRNMELAGTFNDDDRIASFSLYSPGEERCKLPFLKYRWNADVGFDTLKVTLREQGKGDDLTGFTGSLALYGLRVMQPRVAANLVSFNKLGLDFTVNVGKDFAELDSASEVTFDRLVFHPYFKYRPFPVKQVTLAIHKPEFPAEELFSSLPGGLFTNLENIRVKGDLSFDLDFFVDLSQPDSLVFASDLSRHGFGVISYGNAGLAKIDSAFPYTAYERGEPVRTFMVGPENPNYRPLDRISHYLQVSVLNSEDGAFYQHRGFMPDAFRESIITNIKERRFVRGGSTITMQLVKNVFLSRNKNIARKLEEVLLVWLIENQGLCTKDRMFEVYLNIIEWGPMIYGANEAARFYFNKDASKLTLGEAIFMASIIPRPKWFKYAFEPDGRLRESEKGFYRILSEKMLRKGQITLHDLDNLDTDIRLKGPARLLIQKTDSVPPDSLLYPDLNLLE